MLFDLFGGRRSHSLHIAARQHPPRARAKYPSKVDFYAWRMHYGPAPDVPYTVRMTGVVDLMNDFGAMIPHTYRCDFDRNSRMTVWVTPGG